MMIITTIIAPMMIVKKYDNSNKKDNSNSRNKSGHGNGNNNYR